MPFTLEDAIRCFDGLSIGAGGAAEEFNALIVVADQEHCWRLASDSSGKCSCTSHAAQPKKSRPQAAVTIWYKTTLLATKDFHGEISESQWMKLYTRGLLRYYGPMSYAKKLDAPFKAMLARYYAEVGGDLPPSVAAFLKTAVTYENDIEAAAASANGFAPLVEEGDDEPSTAPASAPASAPATAVGATSISSAPAPAAAVPGPLPLAAPTSLGGASTIIGPKDGEATPRDEFDEMLKDIEEGESKQDEPWWRVHFGTDMLLGCWLLVLGCVVYTVICIPFVVAEPWRADKWCELIASLIFVFGCYYLAAASYPDQMVILLEHLAKPPRKLTLLERYVTSNRMLLATQLFNLGMVPYFIEALVNMVSPPPGDPPGAALGLLLGLIFAMPLLVLFTATAMDENMRKNRGSGTSFAWDGGLKACVRRCAGESRVAFWQQHLGSDMIFIFWVFCVLMAISIPAVLPLWLYDLDDSEKLCGPISCFNNLVMLVPFTAGSLLMLRASYPDNFGQSLFFPARDPDDDDDGDGEQEEEKLPWKQARDGLAAELAKWRAWAGSCYNWDGLAADLAKWCAWAGSLVEQQRRMWEK